MYPFFSLVTYKPSRGDGCLHDLPLVSREWKNGSNSSYNCTPFLHSLLTKGKFMLTRVKRVQRGTLD